jgi:hypothetical protein
MASLLNVESTLTSYRVLEDQNHFLGIVGIEVRQGVMKPDGQEQ